MDTTSFEYTYNILPENQKTSVIVRAILAYNKVSLSLEPNLSFNEDIRNLNKEIQIYVNKQLKIEHIELGIPCIAHYSHDGFWYRAQVYNIGGLDCGQIMVFFVDFGNVDSVSVDKIRMMRPEWFKLPVLCYNAFLNFELKSNNHNEYVYQHIQKFFGQKKLCEVVRKDPLTVNLYNKSEKLAYLELIQSGLIKIK